MMRFVKDGDKLTGAIACCDFQFWMDSGYGHYEELNRYSRQGIVTTLHFYWFLFVSLCITASRNHEIYPSKSHEI